jgi:hypothetical protein
VSWLIQAIVNAVLNWLASLGVKVVRREHAKGEIDKRHREKAEDAISKKESPNDDAFDDSTRNQLGR